MSTDKIMMTTGNPYLNGELTDEVIKKIEKEMRDAISATSYSIPTFTFNSSSITPTMTTEKGGESVKLQDKWIWVEGYKGTTKEMRGHGDYQFEIGKRYDMPLDVEIRDCHAGFHLSLNMKDVFNHYNIGKGNRFFKVRALVRERDLNEYGKKTGLSGYFSPKIRNKLASQSIEFIRELTMDEVFQDTEYASWSDEYKKLAMDGDLVDVKHMVMVNELGYSKPFATHIVKMDKYDTAKAVASQPDLSMDMKALMIMNW